MTTLKDVAKEAGLSLQTVSRILNNRGYISEAARKKVYAAIEHLDYKPNEMARALFRKKTNIIGFIVPMVSHPFFAEMAGYIERYAHEQGYKTLICNSDSDIEKEKEYLELIGRNQVDGIIGAFYNTDIGEHIKSSLPLVTIDRQFDGIPYVSSDHYEGGYMATQLLIDKGCTYIAHISGDLGADNLGNRRSKAFIDSVSRNNVRYILEETSIASFDLVNGFFEKYPDVDGLFAGSDILAASIIYVANSIGKRIPQDLKLIGYDDIDMASMTVPALSTIKQDIRKIAETSVQLLISRIDDQPNSIENILPISIIERETT